MNWLRRLSRERLLLVVKGQLPEGGASVEVLPTEDGGQTPSEVPAQPPQAIQAEGTEVN